MRQSVPLARVFTRSTSAPSSSASHCLVGLTPSQPLSLLSLLHNVREWGPDKIKVYECQESNNLGLKAVEKKKKKNDEEQYLLAATGFVGRAQ